MEFASGRPVKAIGLMSGTSLDGIDVALIETDGESVQAFGPGRTFAYSEDDRALFVHALADATGMEERTARPGVLAQAERRLTERHAQALSAFLEEYPQHRDVAAIGFHGQTVLHRPERALTVQLGDGPALARAVREHAPNAAVVYDLRAADVAAGGQGAPLVPVYHRALVQRLGEGQPKGPVLVLNLGGVANITFLNGEGDPLAGDTGPANALVDDFMKLRTGVPVDHGGEVAARGEIDEAALARLMDHEFFARPFPKSLDRNAFRDHVARLAGLDARGTEDGAALLTALTAASVAASLKLLPQPAEMIIVAGGGAHNRTLMAMLAARSEIEIVSAQALGWSGDFLEAQAFAFLAVRSLRGLPISFPSTTGVPAPMTGGVVVP